MLLITKSTNKNINLFFSDRNCDLILSRQTTHTRRTKELSKLFKLKIDITIRTVLKIILKIYCLDIIWKYFFFRDQTLNLPHLPCFGVNSVSHRKRKRYRIQTRWRLFFALGYLFQHLYNYHKLLYFYVSLKS